MKSPKSKKAFRVISSRTVFRGYVSQLDVLQIQTASGRRVERELIKHPGAVVIIPRLKDGRFILIRQLRVATGRKIWELPAGTLERGESTFQCARRELQEETCWKPGRLRKVLEFFPTPGISTEKMYLFIASDLRKATNLKPDLDEELEVKTFSLPQIEKMIRKAGIVDGKTILGFLFFLKFFSLDFFPRKAKAR